MRKHAFGEVSSAGQMCDKFCTISYSITVVGSKIAVTNFIPEMAVNHLTAFSYLIAFAALRILGPVISKERNL